MPPATTWTRPAPTPRCSPQPAAAATWRIARRARTASPSSKRPEHLNSPSERFGARPGDFVREASPPRATFVPDHSLTSPDTRPPGPSQVPLLRDNIGLTQATPALRLTD